jgi:hypothetical protein
MEKHVPFSTLKILICKKYSFPNLTQFSQGNSVLESPASDRASIHLETTMLQEDSSEN